MAIIRTTSMFPSNEQGLVDKFIGTAYDTVKLVSINMEHVVKVSEEIDTLPESAQQIFEEAVKKHMPGAYKQIDSYTNSKKPEIDKYVEQGKKDVTQHTTAQKATIDSMVQESTKSITLQVDEGLSNIKDQVKIATVKASEASTSAEEAKQAKNQTLDQLRLNQNQVKLAQAEVLNAKTEADRAARIKAETQLIQQSVKLSEDSANKSASDASFSKDTAISASVSAKYAQEEALRSETEVKRIQGEVDAKAVQVNTNTQAAKESRDDAFRFRNESESFKNSAEKSNKEAEDWAQKARENSAVDVTAFVGKSDLLGTTGNSITKTLHQKGITDYLNSKRDFDDTQFATLYVGESTFTSENGVLTVTSKVSDDITAIVTFPAKTGEVVYKEQLDSLDDKVTKGLASKQNNLKFTGKGSVVTEDKITKDLDGSDNVPTALAVKTVTDTLLTKDQVRDFTGDSVTDPISQKAATEAIGAISSKAEATYQTIKVAATKAELSSGLSGKLDNGRISTSVGSSNTNAPTELAVSNAIKAHHDSTKLDSKNVTSSFGNSDALVSSQKLVTGLNNQLANLNLDISKKADNASITKEITRVEGLTSDAKKQADKGVSDAATAQAKADQGVANAATAQSKANSAHTIASAAIPNSKKTSGLGTSTDLVATQKLVNDVSIRTTTAQNSANSANAAAKKAQETADSGVKLFGALNTINLDTLNDESKCGVYYQNANANATPERNYPVGLAGTLEVFNAAGITQRYMIYSNHDIYIRNSYGGKWDTWTKIPNTSDVDSIEAKTKTAQARADLGVSNASKAQSQADLGVKNAATAQSKADSAYSLANTANNTANNAIPNAKKTNSLGTSTDLVASQKLVNDVSIRVTNAQTKADKGVNDAAAADKKAVAAQTQANKGVTDASSALARAEVGVKNASTAQARADSAYSLASGKTTEAWVKSQKYITAAQAPQGATASKFSKSEEVFQGHQAAIDKSVVRYTNTSNFFEQAVIEKVSGDLRAIRVNTSRGYYPAVNNDGIISNLTKVIVAPGDRVSTQVVMGSGTVKLTIYR